MTAKDQLKLLKAGFTIIRVQHLPGSLPIVKHKDNEHREWTTLIYCNSIAESKRAVQNLLMQDKIVED